MRFGGFGIGKIAGLALRFHVKNEHYDVRNH